MRITVLLFMLLFQYVALYGQEGSKDRATLIGRIVDFRGNSVPFASVALLDGDSLIIGTISNEAGIYRLSRKFFSQRQYRLQVSSLGYQPG